MQRGAVYVRISIHSGLWTNIRQICPLRVSILVYRQCSSSNSFFPALLSFLQVFYQHKQKGDIQEKNSVKKVGGANFSLVLPGIFEDFIKF